MKLLYILSLVSLVLADDFSKPIPSSRLVEDSSLTNLESYLSEQGIDPRDVRGIVIEPHDASQQRVVQHKEMAGAFDDLKEFIVSQGFQFQDLRNGNTHSLQSQPLADPQVQQKRAPTIFRYGSFHDLRDYILSQGGVMAPGYELQSTETKQENIKTEETKSSNKRVVTQGTFEELRDYVISQGAEFRDLRKYEAEIEASKPKLLTKHDNKRIMRQGTLEELQNYVKSQGVLLNNDLEPKSTQSRNGRQVLKAGTLTELQDYLTSNGIVLTNNPNFQSLQSSAQEDHSIDLQARSTAVMSGTLEELRNLVISEGGEFKDLQTYQAEFQAKKSAKKPLQTTQSSSKIIKYGSFDELKDYIVSQGAVFNDLSGYQQSELSQAQAQPQEVQPQEVQPFQPMMYGTFEELKQYLASQGAEVQDFRHYHESFAKTHLQAHTSETPEFKPRKTEWTWGTFEDLRDNLLGKGAMFYDLRPYANQRVPDEYKQGNAQFQSLQSYPEPRSGTSEELREYLKSQGLSVRDVQGNLL